VAVGPAAATATVQYNVSRLQLLWRWMKTRTIVEDTIFRLIHKEMDLKKEGFAIFKAHDRADASHFSAPKRSRSVLQNPVVAPASTTHYFPCNPSVPITFDHIRQMINDLTNHTLLPYPAAWRIFTDALNHLNTLPNVVRLSPPVGARTINGRTVQGGKTIVVGDLHGQLADLLHILREGGQPDDSTFYVFNGDFVDRGPHGVEVLLVLFSLMLAFPKYVALNRGNHECDYMNEEYGFDVEVSTKYDRNVFRIIQRCFCALPLATLVANSTFVVHGGLPRRKGVTLDDIGRIQRFRQVPMPEHTQPEEDEMFQDLLWSDPWENPGWKESERGAGVQFGPDVTSDFCKTNKIDLVIRSHEEFQKGYEEHHHDNLITVFSASNYDGPETNKGAFAVLVGENTEPSYHCYQVYEEDLDEYGAPEVNLSDTLGTLAFTPTMKYAAGSFSASSFHALAGTVGSGAGGHRLSIGAGGGGGGSGGGGSRRRVRDEVLRILRERIYQRRHRLLAYFTKLDRTRKGSLWKIEWVETMRNVLNLNLPWYFLRHYIVDEDPATSRINYATFLCKFRQRLLTLWLPEWEQSILQQLCARQRTAQRAMQIQNAFSKEWINYNEFCSAMRTIDYTMSDAQLFQLFQYHDVTKLGHIAGQALLESLQTGGATIMSSASSAALATPRGGAAAMLRAGGQPLNSSTNLKWDLDTMEQLQNTIIQGRSQLQALFKISQRDRTLSREKYSHGMTQLGRGMRKQLTPAQKDAIFAFLSNGKEEVEWDKFLQSVTIEDCTDKRHSVVEFGFGDPTVPATPVGAGLGKGGVPQSFPSPTALSNRGTSPTPAAS